jgi:hypothetical protein
VGRDVRGAGVEIMARRVARMGKFEAAMTLKPVSETARY